MASPCFHLKCPPKVHLLQARFTAYDTIGDWTYKRLNQVEEAMLLGSNISKPCLLVCLFAFSHHEVSSALSRVATVPYKMTGPKQQGHLNTNQDLKLWAKANPCSSPAVLQLHSTGAADPRCWPLQNYATYSAIEAESRRRVHYLWSGQVADFKSDLRAFGLCIESIFAAFKKYFITF